MEQYQIYAQIVFDLEAKDEDEAKKLASEKFRIIVESAKDLNISVSDAKVAHKRSGYFIK